MFSYTSINSCSTTRVMGLPMTKLPGIKDRKSITSEDMWVIVLEFENILSVLIKLKTPRKLALHYLQSTSEGICWFNPCFSQFTRGFRVGMHLKLIPFQLSCQFFIRRLIKLLLFLNLFFALTTFLYLSEKGIKHTPCKLAYLLTKDVRCKIR